MLKYPEPTGEQCNTNALLAEDKHEIAYAIWYPQMGGYVGRAVVVMSRSETEPCFDVFVWHNGEFPFGDDEPPVHIHHCSAEHFIRFGEKLQHLRANIPPEQRKVAALTADEQELLDIAKDGFKTAKLYRANWFEGVNSCPYGPAVPGEGNVKAEAWYKGWWFFHHTIKPWAELLQRLSTM